MKEYRIGASIIYHPEYYVMHRRKPGIDNGEVNKLGLYGGQFDPIEDLDTRDTASRELTEESGMQFRVADFRAQKSVFVRSERNGSEVVTEADIFLIQLPIDVTHDMFRSGEPLTERELRRAKALGELTSVAAEALIVNGVI